VPKRLAQPTQAETETENMRAEIEHVVEEMQQSIGLLRRHL
jgi:hypothetical protein